MHFWHIGPADYQQLPLALYQAMVRYMNEAVQHG